jgi:hypothetical protein
MGAATVAVPLLLVAPTVAAAVASAAAGRFAAVRAGRLAAATGVGALLLAAGALVPHPAGMLPVAVALGVFQLGIVLTDARLQDSITGPVRATVTSVAAVGAEAVALVVILAFAVGSRWWGVPALVALCAAPLLGLAWLVRRWLPAPRG